jgi:peptide/nickel transport system permease protein
VRVGFAALLAATLLALVVPWLSPFAYDAIDLGSIKEPPGGAHWMGTDELGRDFATRVFAGARLSLAIGIAGALAASVLGAGLGASAGYFGGVTDAALMRLADLMLSIPLLPALIVISAIFRPSVPVLVLLLSAFAWMEPARIARSEVLRLKELPFTEAAKALGASSERIIGRHLLPNASAPLVVAGAILVGRVIVMESVLSFLGLGVQPPSPSLGNLLYGAQASLATEPWLAIFPGTVIFWIVLAVNAVGEGLSLRRHERPSG